jgi:hypothetical protein
MAWSFRLLVVISLDFTGRLDHDMAFGEIDHRNDRLGEGQQHCGTFHEPKLDQIARTKIMDGDDLTKRTAAGL